jgi:hypothetical protein
VTLGEKKGFVKNGLTWFVVVACIGLVGMIGCVVIAGVESGVILTKVQMTIIMFGPIVGAAVMVRLLQWTLWRKVRDWHVGEEYAILTVTQFHRKAAADYLLAYVHVNQAAPGAHPNLCEEHIIPGLEWLALEVKSATDANIKYLLGQVSGKENSDRAGDSIGDRIAERATDAKKRFWQVRDCLAAMNKGGMVWERVKAINSWTALP